MFWKGAIYVTEQEKLLSEVSKILEKHETSRQLTGSDFNIFSILNVESDETKICRVVKELLDPRGTHYQDNIYLKLFLEEVMDIHNVDSKNAIIRREDRTGEGNRVDITIDIKPSYFIAIEVKINAPLGKDQLERYYNDAKKRNPNPNPIIVYLSKFKNPPLDKNNGLGNTLKAKDVKHITWSEDIINWLELCLQQPQTQQIASIQEILKQLISIIKKFCGQLEDDEIMDTKTLITQSPENLRSAHALAVAFDKYAGEKVKYIIEKLIKKIKEKTKKPFEYEKDGSSISKKADTFYNYKEHSCDYGYIGMNCEYKKIKFHSSEIRIDHHFLIGKDGIFYGYYLPGKDNAGKYYGEYKEDASFCEELKKALPPNIKFDESTKTDWVSSVEYQGDAPNFYDFSDVKTLEFLSDDKRIESFIEDFSDKIKNLVDGNP